MTLPKDVMEAIDKKYPDPNRSDYHTEMEFEMVLMSSDGSKLRKAAKFGYSLAEKEIADKDAEIEKLKKEIKGWYRYKANIDEALNSGDGVYRP